MTPSRALSGVSLAVALSAFGLAAALSLRAQVEPFYAVLRSVIAFVGVLYLARWAASVLDSFGGRAEPPQGPEEALHGPGGGERTAPRRPRG